MSKFLSNVYTKLGVRPVINASSNTTTWGGSLPSLEVRQAMEKANIGFVEMRELLETSGSFIAKILDVEAAYVTSGCYAALVLSSAACMTGNDPEKMTQLPNTYGMKNEILIQKQHRYSYDRSYTVAGAKLIEVGNEEGTTLKQLENAIGGNTAAIAYLIESDPKPDELPLDAVLHTARQHKVPVIADAAAQIFPLSYFKANAQSADLVCFGGKYFGAPQSTGLVCGTKNLVDTVSNHGFIGPRPFGRGMKLDRQEIVGLTTALETWFNTDHEERMLDYSARFEVIQKAVNNLDSVITTKVITNNRYWSVELHITIDPAVAGKTAPDIAQELLDGTPRVRLRSSGPDTISVMVHNLNDGDDQLVADALRNTLSPKL